MNNENKKELLTGIYSQISSFDNKASILISVIGIVFALLLDFTNVFSSKEFINLQNDLIKISFYISFILFCLSAVFSILCNILVIKPRSHKEKNKYINFYKDIAKMSQDEFGHLLNSKKSEKYLDDQIRINAKICNKKDLWLKAGLYGLISFAISLISMITLILFIF